MNPAAPYELVLTMANNIAKVTWNKPNKVICQSSKPTRVNPHKFHAYSQNLNHTRKSSNYDEEQLNYAVSLQKLYGG